MRETLHVVIACIITIMLCVILAMSLYIRYEYGKAQELLSENKTLKAQLSKEFDDLKLRTEKLSVVLREATAYEILIDGDQTAPYGMQKIEVEPELEAEQVPDEK